MFFFSSFIVVIFFACVHIQSVFICWFFIFIQFWFQFQIVWFCCCCCCCFSRSGEIYLYLCMKCVNVCMCFCVGLSVCWVFFCVSSSPFFYPLFFFFFFFGYNHFDSIKSFAINHFYRFNLKIIKSFSVLILIARFNLQENVSNHNYHMCVHEYMSMSLHKNVTMCIWLLFFFLCEIGWSFRNSVCLENKNQKLCMHVVCSALKKFEFYRMNSKCS